jgi:glycogen phosphorylase
MSGTPISIEISPVLPARIERLAELADDLLYSWDRKVRALYYRLDSSLWESSGHNPKVFLRRVSQARLDAAAVDRGFLEVYNQALSAYDTYMQEGMRSGIETLFDPRKDLIAYFCAEFGFHESVPIYSGGLGILAGDHCKASSDLGIPFVAVGLLYRQGYFNQTIDGDGHQHAHYAELEFEDLPIRPETDAAGRELTVAVILPGREVTLRIWRAKAGHITLYLLDADIEQNAPADRAITHQLYGGDIHTRIQQEIVLGIGGVRALRRLGLAPTVWHINEGHAAFQILERCREHVEAGLDFAAAIELTAAATVFTTHTPVSAGHDIFSDALFEQYLAPQMQGLGLNVAALKALGQCQTPGGFNMTSLALRGSRAHNGVSRVHGHVASRMESYHWPQIPPDENPIAHVTNGVHLPTFLARDWVNLFDSRFPDWRNELLNEDYWSCIDRIPDHRFWSLRLELQTEMLTHVARRALARLRRNGESELAVKRLLKLTAPGTDVLVLGFARRFATYKRATLLLREPERLSALLNNPERPVLMIFAGKAHPHDAPGQELIREIHEYSQRPEFAGRLILLEGYDLALARKLVMGVDVWINTPQYPLEASGTSGQKAAINGVLNLSVLDGWWEEGYEGNNGWAITPHGADFEPGYRDQQEANDLLGILEQEIVPLYFQRGQHGYSTGWIARSKASMKSIIPRFNAQRMVMDYVSRFYGPARDHQLKLASDGARGARELALWKDRISRLWPGVRMRAEKLPPRQAVFGQSIPLSVSVALNGLDARDIVVECLLGERGKDGELCPEHTDTLRSVTSHQGVNEAHYALDLKPSFAGLKSMEIRAYPHHRLLAHRFEMGRMIWL